jgi:hypothetical protein
MNMHGIKLEPYVPTSIDLAFTVGLIAKLRVGGVWAIPRCAMTYQKVSDKKIKLIDFMESKNKDVKMAQALDHHALKACCKKLFIEVDESLLEKKPKAK